MPPIVPATLQTMCVVPVCAQKILECRAEHFELRAEQIPTKVQGPPSFEPARSCLVHNFVRMGYIYEAQDLLRSFDTSHFAQLQSRGLLDHSTGKFFLMEFLPARNDVSSFH